MAETYTANVTKYITTVSEYNAYKLDLEQKILNINRKEANGTATSEDRMFKNSLEAQLSNLQLNPPSPLETNKTTSSSAENLANSGSSAIKNLSQQEAILANIAKIPVPEKNNVGQIRYVQIDPNNLYDYINATQHLNPWGRERQCDKDLKNLMLHVNADMRNQLGHLQQITTQLSSLS